MKRILALALLVLIATPAWAGVITYDSSATATKTWITGALDTIYSEVNGALDTDNLSQGAVTSLDIATAANPLVRGAENIGEYVYTGLVPPTSASLTATTTAGTAYVLNDGDNTLHRVVKAATAKVYTASKDTWVYLGFDGYYKYEEVANDAAQPTTPDNTIIIAKVTTDGTTVTTVTDQRQTTPPNLRVYQDAKLGLVISRDVTDVNSVGIGRGTIDFGSSIANGLRRNIISTDIDFGVSGRGGLAAADSFAAGYWYLYAVADDDNSTGFEGIAGSTTAGVADVDDEKLVGWCYATDASTISPDAFGAYRGLGGDAPNIYSASQSELSMAHAARTSIIIHKAKYYSSGRPVMMHYGVTEDSGSGEITWLSAEISIDSVSLPNSRMYDSLEESGSGTASGTYYTDLNQGTHDIELTATSLNSTTENLTGWYLIVEEK